MLTIDSVELNFGERSIISGGYLNVSKGEVVGLLGRNGCGKSSLLKIIFGALIPGYKHMRLDGVVVSKKGYFTRQIAYLPQDDFLPNFLKVRDLLCPIDDFKDIDAVYEIRDKYLRDLSGGALRLVACLWILSLPADYILLDEPFNGLSPVNIAVVQQFIEKQKPNKGIVLTDHTYRPLLEVADRIVLMHNNAVYTINCFNDLVHYQYLPASAIEKNQKE